MLLKGTRPVLLVGIGNPLRSDDGAGPYIVRKIAAMNLPGVHPVLAHQLDLELLEEIRDYAAVVIVDASCADKGLTFRKLQTTEGGQPASSHHLSPESFGTLARKLYHQDLDLYVCSVRGDNFDIGEQLSPGVRPLADDAVEKILTFLKGTGTHA